MIPEVQAEGLDVASPFSETLPKPDATEASNGFIRFWRHVYRPLGFNKGYNFPLFIIFAGAMWGFSLARLSYLNISGSSSSSFSSSAGEGEWYWDNQGHYRVGITLHLAAILPMGLLAGWQFVPAIRHKFLLFHRINGYTIFILILISNAGALMIARRAFGGGIDIQAGVGTLVILTTISIFMAYYNIKRLQIDQHRAWMLRAMFYLGSIITLRIIFIISTKITSTSGVYYSTMSCQEIDFLYGSAQPVDALYPQCAQDNSTFVGPVAVYATFKNGQPEQIGANLDINFGMALWLALLLHLVGVEIYLGLTPKESNRLRQVSYERQMERGLKPFGSAGLTADRLGDADAWKPSRETVVKTVVKS